MGLFTEQDEYDDFKVKPKKMNPYHITLKQAAEASKWLIAITLLGLILYFLITMPPEPRNYEVRGADGTVYHTTSISHGTGRIWFTDKNGNRIELGGGYTVIRK